jgi:hypothetical protein
MEQYVSEVDPFSWSLAAADGFLYLAVVLDA